MRALVWDTSSVTGAICVFDLDDVKGAKPVILYSAYLNVEAKHSERLLWGLHHAAEATRARIEDFDFYGVGVGPGSFTGLRMGVATANALSLARGILGPAGQIVPISSLAVEAGSYLARHASNPRTSVIVARDACKNEIYFGVGTRDQWLRDKVKIRILSPEGVAKEMSKSSKVAIVGDAVGRYPILSRFKKRMCPENRILPEILAPLAAWKIQSKAALPAVLPNYLRDSDAEVRLKIKQQAANVSAK